MKNCKTIEELRDQFDGVTSGVAGDTIFGAKALMFIAELLARKSGRQKRKPSQWQKFLSRALKSGKTIQEAATEWKSRKK